MRNVIVIGLGKSGFEAARLLASYGDNVFITEIKNNTLTRNSKDKLIGEETVKPDNIEIGKHTMGMIKNADFAVISPGVPVGSAAVKIAGELDIPIISEMELAYSFCKAPIIAVTGTSGKTTVTTLIGEMLNKAGRHAVVCGNIGNPLSGEIRNIKEDSIVVLEVSSFQLERIKNFRPKTSVILNITENHLDRHRNMEEYISSKIKIFSNQREGDTLFLNGKDPLLKRIASSVKNTGVEFFDKYRDFANRFDISNDNYLAAMSVCSLEGVKEDIMLDVISGFKGIEHRLEYVMTLRGVDFINDSKATTVSSVEWALRNLDKKIILIMGGRYKGGNFRCLQNLIDEKVRAVIAIGEARQNIRSGLADIAEEGTLEQAVDRAFGLAEKGDAILLSPGCSSFDMFENYRERGRIFKETVRRLSLRKKTAEV